MKNREPIYLAVIISCGLVFGVAMLASAINSLAGTSTGPYSNGTHAKAREAREARGETMYTVITESRRYTGMIFKKRMGEDGITVFRTLEGKDFLVHGHWTAWEE